MLDTILRASLNGRSVIMALVLFVSMLGIWNFNRLPIDAVPDITNVQVVINTEAPGYTPLEVEQRVTFPIETAMAGFLTLNTPAQCLATDYLKSQSSLVMTLTSTSPDNWSMSASQM